MSKSRFVAGVTDSEFNSAKEKKAMNMRDLPKLKLLHENSRELVSETSSEGPILRRSSITRRQFAQTTVGATLFGAALGTGLLKPAYARGGGSFTPLPLP